MKFTGQEGGLLCMQISCAMRQTFIQQQKDRQTMNGPTLLGMTL